MISERLVGLFRGLFLLGEAELEPVRRQLEGLGQQVRRLGGSGGQIAQAQSQSRAVERQLEQVGCVLEPVGREMVEIWRLEPISMPRIHAVA